MGAAGQLTLLSADTNDHPVVYAEVPPASVWHAGRCSRDAEMGVSRPRDTCAAIAFLRTC
jgi:hypothetical protein